MRTAARGAVLIGVAVIIGIVLLQVVDEGGPVGGPQAASNGTNRTTSTTAGGRNPQEVTVLVLNGSGLSGAAATKANVLRGLGYGVLPPGNAAVQTGTTIACTDGYETEAETIKDIIDATATVVPFPATPPADSEAAKCIVTLGKAA
jgi:hypothetical protein